MPLRLAALLLGTVTGVLMGWARMTDPATFHRMLALRSPTIYLVMGSAIAVTFVGARLLRGRRALLTGDVIAWQSVRPRRRHVYGSGLFGVGWAVSAVCPGPLAAQLGSGRVLAIAVAAGVVIGVALQPRLAAAVARLPVQPLQQPATALAEADVL